MSLRFSGWSNRKRTAIFSATGLLLVGACALAYLGYSRPSGGLAAIAVASMDNELDIASLLESGGIPNVLSATTVSLALSNFSQVVDVSLTEASRRVRPGDPRRTPLLDALERSFRLDAPNGPWIVAYIPDEAKYLKAALVALEDRDLVWMANGKPTGGRTPVLWLIPLLWCLRFILKPPSRDILFKASRFLAWVPLAFSPGPTAALLALAFIATAATMQDVGMPRRDADGRYHTGLYGLRTTMPQLLPHTFSAALVLAADPSVLPYFGAALALAGLGFLGGGGALALDRARCFHQPPDFIRIKVSPPNSRLLQIIKGFALCASAVLVVSAFIPATPAYGKESTGFLLYFEPVAGDVPDPLAANIAFQAALTWGRLGDAQWGSAGYTAPLEFNLAEESSRPRTEASGGGSVRTGPGKPSRTLSMLYNKGFLPVPVANSIGNATVYVNQLDPKSVFFCIMAIVPGLGAIIYGMINSRRNIIVPGRPRQQI